MHRARFAEKVVGRVVRHFCADVALCQSRLLVPPAWRVGQTATRTFICPRGVETCVLNGDLCGRDRTGLRAMQGGPFRADLPIRSPR